MTLKEIVSVTGISGLKRVVAQRKDGLIASDLDGSNKKFLSARIHMFSPLENISIYTDDNDTVALPEVLLLMKEKLSEVPVIDPNASNDELRAYFFKILPNHDDEKVKISDIKKLIKWFHILQEYDLIQKPEEEPTATAEPALEAEEMKEEAPVAKKPGKKKKA